MITCSFCGQEFDAEAGAACSGCPLAVGCHLVRCPRCGYEMPPEAKLVGWLRRLRQNKDGPNTAAQEWGVLVMKVTETGQELLEQLWMAEEDGRASLPNEDADQNGVEELVKRGLAQWENDVLTLTEVGHSEAAQVMRRHRLAERLLSDVLATEEALLDGRACRMEHALFDGVDDSICTLLGHPRFCPHGKPIPQGQCCQQQRQSLGKLIMPLRDLRMGQEGHIAYTRLGSPERAQKLMAMGVLPGVPVRLLHSFPSFVFEAGYSQFAVDEEIAADIYVRLAN